MENTFYILMALIVGGSLGSFFKLTVDRYDTGTSIIFKPSFCLSCNENINWYHNIPIVSFILLKGKCSGCKEKIDFYNFLSELVVGILTVIFYLIISEKEMPLSLQISSYLFISILIWLSIFDLKHRIIPHKITYTSICLVLIYSFFTFDSHLTPFENLGISFFFMDALVAFIQIVRRQKIEQSHVVLPIIVWLIIFYFTKDIFWSVAFGVINLFLIIKGTEIKNLFVNLILWISTISLFLFQFSKLIFVDFNFVNLAILLSGIGIIYLFCDVFLYFIHLFFFSKDEDKKNEELDIKNIAMGGGDITVFVLVAVYLGYIKAFFALFLASILALIFTLIRTTVSKIFIKDKLVSQFIPFVPFIALACFIIILAFKL